MTPPRAPQWEARRASEGWYVADPKGEAACLVLGDDFMSEGNAKFLALAANAYTPLVEALEATTAELAKWWPGCLEHDNDECWPDALCGYCTGERAIEAARAAVALTRAEAGSE